MRRIDALEDLVPPRSLVSDNRKTLRGKFEEIFGVSVDDKRIDQKLEELAHDAVLHGKGVSVKVPLWIAVALTLRSRAGEKKGRGHPPKSELIEEVYDDIFGEASERADDIKRKGEWKRMPIRSLKDARRQAAEEMIKAGSVRELGITDTDSFLSEWENWTRRRRHRASP